MPISDTTGVGSALLDGSPIQIFDSMADDEDPLANSKVSVGTAGRYEYWTPAQRVWEVASSAAGPIRVIPDALQSAKPDGVENVLDYGAFTDVGPGDPARNLQKAIDALPSEGGTVRVPAGT